MTETERAVRNIKRWRADPVAFVREVFGVEPDPWQAEALKVFPSQDPELRRIAMKAPLCVESEVWTPLGKRRWGDILPGDHLFSEDGEPIQVISRYDAGKIVLYRVKFRDGTSLRVSAEHEWDVQTPYDRKYNFRRTVSTAELATMCLRGSSGQRYVSIPQQGPAQFPIALLPADPYVFGLWLGDGVANEPRLIAPDAGIREAIRSRGQEITESEAVPKRIGLTGFISALRETGAIHCRSFEKFIPEKYKLASVEQRRLLLQGLMDSDGTCAKNGHCYLASSSERLIDDFIWLARSLGYMAGKMGPYQINGGGNRDSYRATICGIDSPFLADTKKLRRWRPAKPWKVMRFIESIEQDGEGEAMCVEVDHPSHCFLASDFIVTHNCKGPGKTCLLAWMIWNFMACYGSIGSHPKGAATSVTSDNLRDNLWPELAKWQGRSAFLSQKFQWQAERIFAKDHPETWFFSARAWPRTADVNQQANTLAGLHADYLLFVLDESGGIPDSVMATAEAGLSTGIWGKIVQAGNPTTLEGPLYRATTSERHLWYLIEITGDPDDPKRSSRISVQWAREQIEKYGRDNPWVLVNVFGRFPPASLNSLIGPDECTDSMKRHYAEPEYGYAPRILGVDVARFGDDATLIYPRQGLASFKPVQMRGARTNEIAARIALAWDKWKPDAVFLDDTGGWAAGVIDCLLIAGYNPIPVNFSGKAMDQRYLNKRAEMYFDAVEWVKNGGALYPEPEITRELTAHSYTFKNGKFQIEEKDQVKEKLNGHSPDYADAFVLTFAQPVFVGLRHPDTGLPLSSYKGQTRTVTDDYDPFRE